MIENAGKREVRAYTSLRDVRGRGAAPQPRQRLAAASRAGEAPAPLQLALALCGGDEVAIYRLSASIVKRSEGRSVVAAAAYRSGTRLVDERAGQVFDYRRKTVLHAEILAPAGAPAWMSDRQLLWAAVEAQERRKDAQLAREVQLALPHECSPRQRIELVRTYVLEQFVSRGMVADIALHPPDRDGDGRNWHAHVLLSLRSIDGDGFGPKQRDWNSDELLMVWRSSWQDHVNAALARAGASARVDHRSLRAQGVRRVSQRKRGRRQFRGADPRALEIPPPIVMERWQATARG